MSRTEMPYELPAESIHVTRWDDPVVDLDGHDLRSTYVERFWLTLLGPSTTLLIRRIARELELHPDGFDLHLVDTAASLGLGLRGGTRGPFLRAIARTGQFDITRPVGPRALACRTRLATLSHRQAERLPEPLQREHGQWREAAATTPSGAQAAERAGRLALSLLELGDAPDVVEAQLHRWSVAPTTADQALRWATDAHRAAG